MTNLVGQYVTIRYGKTSQGPLTIEGKLREVTEDGSAWVETLKGQVLVWPVLEIKEFEDNGQG